MLVFLTMYVLAGFEAIHLVQLLWRWVAVAKYGSYIEGMAFQIITPFLGVGAVYLLGRLLITRIFAEKQEEVERVTKAFEYSLFLEMRRREDRDKRTEGMSNAASECDTKMPILRKGEPDDDIL